MIGRVHLQLHVHQLRLCPPLRSRRGILASIRIAQFVKISLSGDLKRGRCRVTIFTIRIALFLGWYSTTRALSAALSCLHLVLVVRVAIKEQAMIMEAQAQVEAAAVGTTVIQTRGGGICHRSCGLLAHPTKTVLIMVKVEELVLRHPLMKRTMR